MFFSTIQSFLVQHHDICNHYHLSESISDTTHGIVYVEMHACMVIGYRSLN